MGENYLQSEEYLAFKYDRKLVDSGITELGVQQSLKAKEQMHNVPLDVVIVSPLRRALATCH